MPTKASPAKVLLGKRNESAPLLYEPIESESANEKERIDLVNAEFEAKRKEIAKSLDMKGAEVYLREQKKSYDSYFAKFDKKAVDTEKSRTQLRREIARNALKKYPALNELARLDSKQMNQLQNVLHPGHSRLGQEVNRGLLTDLEVLLPEHEGLASYTVFEPPYSLSGAENVGVDFDVDNSFPWADWGTLHQNVRLNQEHSWTDFTGSASRYAYNSVDIGVNYRMPRHGFLDITVVLLNQDNQVDISVTNNWGPSSATGFIGNKFFVEVLAHQERQYLHGEFIFHHAWCSDGFGDDISQSVQPVTTNTPIIINLRTTGRFHQNEDVQIKVASFLRAYCLLKRMDAEIKTNLLWKVDKIYVRPV